MPQLPAEAAERQRAIEQLPLDWPLGIAATGLGALVAFLVPGVVFGLLGMLALLVAAAGAALLLSAQGQVLPLATPLAGTLLGSGCAFLWRLAIEGRDIPFVARSDEVAWFDFDAICDGPRSPADYVEIARDFHTVLVSGVPQMDQTLDNPARRFIALVDEFYDRGVKLVLAAHAPIDDLYVGDRLRFEFDRTRSRLAEMQTREYLARPHSP